MLLVTRGCGDPRPLPDRPGDPLLRRPAGGGSGGVWQPGDLRLSERGELSCRLLEQTRRNGHLPEGGTRDACRIQRSSSRFRKSFVGGPVFDARQVHRLRGLREQLSGTRNPGLRCLPGDPHPASTSAAAAPTAGAARMSARKKRSP